MVLFIPKAQKGNRIITAAPLFNMNITLIRPSDEESLDTDGQSLRF